MRVIDVPRRYSQLLSQVWEFLRARPGLRTDGHNVMIYHHGDKDPRDETIPIEFGVQVASQFEGVGDVICSTTPAGTVAATIHEGPYGKLGEAHDAIVKWCSANNRSRIGTIWEIYGDWNEDESKLETEVLHLLREG